MNPVMGQYEVTLFQEWVSNTGTQTTFYQVKPIVDSNGNSYVAGATLNGNGDYDVLLTKYNRDGDELWTDQINGSASGDDFATDLEFDNSGNILLTGGIANSTTGYDLLLVKYATSGSVTFTINYHSGALDAGSSVTHDSSGNIYVVGTSLQGTDHDFLALKYTSSGTQQWSSIVDYGGLDDAFIKVTYKNGELVAFGGAELSSAIKAIVTKDLNPSTGAVIATYTSTPSGSSVSTVYDGKIDDNGNIFLCGSLESSGNLDAIVIKLNSSLIEQWAVTYTGGLPGDAVAHGLDIGTGSKTYVTGYVTDVTGDKDLFLLKLNSNGSQAWQQLYDDDTNSDNIGQAVYCSDDNKIYLTGSSHNISNTDIITQKYSTAGVEEWTMHYNGIANGEEKGMNIAMNEDNDIIVVGQSEKHTAGQYEYVTIKYVEESILAPMDEEGMDPMNWFLPNLNQVRTTTGTMASSVKYFASNTWPQSFVKSDELELVFLEDDSVGGTIDYHKIELGFNNTAMPKGAFRAYDKSDFYSSFYLGDIPDGPRPRLQHQRFITRTNVADDVDVHLSNDEGGLKIHYVLAPGGTPADMELTLDGHSSVALSGGDLRISTSIDDLIFHPAEAYQVNSGGTRINLGWTASYTIVNQNLVRFNLGSYNTSMPLILELDQSEDNQGSSVADGNLIWSTYLGAASFTTFLNDVTADDFGNVYYSGHARYFEDFPILMGTSDAPFEDTQHSSILLKINHDIEGVWAAYLGGSDPVDESADIYDHTQASALNETGDRIAIGGYSSTTDLPLLNPVDSENTTDGTSEWPFQDCFIAEFNELGILQFSTYYGGVGGDEQVNTLIYNSSDELYALGVRNDNSPLQAQIGASNYTTGNGLILKFSSDHQLLWSNAYEVEEIKASAIDSNDNLYIAGQVFDNAMPTLATDADHSSIMDAYNGSNMSADGFVAKFNSQGLLNYSFYYGENCATTIRDIVVDNNDNLIACGAVTAGNPCSVISGTLPVLNGYSANSADIGEHFLFKVEPQIGTNDINLLHASYFGGSWEERFFNGGLAVDDGNRIYFTSTTKSSPLNGTTNIQMPSQQPNDYYVESDLTPDNLNNWKYDAYILGLDSDFTLRWSTYFGGQDDDGGYKLAYSSFDERLFFAGATFTNNSFVSNPDLELPIEEYDDSDGTSDLYYPIPIQGELPGTAWPAWTAFFDISSGFYVGLEEQQIGDDGVTLFPNPADNYLSVESEVPFLQISILDLAGRRLLTHNISLTNQAGIDLGELASGSYLIQVRTEKGLHISKFVKQ